MMKAVDIIRRYRNDNEFSIWDGAIYKKAPNSVFTFMFCSTVKCFLLKLLGNSEIADQIVSVVPALTNLLSEPDCRLIEPISIDYNFIECLPRGTCFDIQSKVFQKDPAGLRGSPRAYVLYEFDEHKEPYPEPFVEGYFTI